MFWTVTLFFLACASAYRASAFIHELVHQRTNPHFDRNFVLFWHLTGGLLCLVPSPAFNKHLEHHSDGIFGTQRDSQYYLIKEGGAWHLERCFLLFIAYPLIAPLMNLVRVLLHIPSIIVPKLKHLFFDFRGRLKFSDREWDLINWVDAYYFWVMLIMLIVSVEYPKVFILWYFVSVGAWFLSSLRVPLEHSLTDYSLTSDRTTQIIDSFDFKRTWRKPLRSIYSFIVQPLGLNWHKQHHANPSIPYYQLIRKD